VRWLEDSVELAREIGAEGQLALSLVDLGELSLRRGRLGDAAALLEESRAMFERAADSGGEGNALLGLGEVARQQGDLVTAERRVLEAKDVFQRAANQTGVAGALNNLGDIARQQGRHAEAEGHYGQAVRILESMGVVEAVYPRLNLGLVAIESDQYALAREHLDVALAAVQGSSRREISGMVHLLLATCDAHDGRWAAWDLHIAEAERWIAETHLVDVDLAHAARRAQQLARAAGHADRAARAARLEAAQWAELGRPPGD
jgi:tetratricopeptide (TPR) repeat protein